MTKLDKMQLCELIGLVANNDPGPIRLPDDRVIVGSHYHCDPSHEDVTDHLHFVTDPARLRPFVVALLESGKAFVVGTGHGEAVCVLRWSFIDDLAPSPNDRDDDDDFD